MKRWTKLATSTTIFDGDGNELCAISNIISGPNLSALCDIFFLLHSSFWVFERELLICSGAR